MIDATDATLGRLASFAAKQALLGQEIVIVNSEKAVIIGNNKDIIVKYVQKRQRGGSAQKGPNFPSLPEFILKRTIRGMLDYKRGRGHDAFKRIKCYRGLPDEFKNANKIVSGKKKQRGFIRLENLAGHLKAYSKPITHRASE